MSKKLYIVLKKKSSINGNLYTFHEAGAIWEAVPGSTGRFELSTEDRSGTYEKHKHSLSGRPWHFSHDKYYGPMELDKAVKLSKDIRKVN